MVSTSNEKVHSVLTLPKTWSTMAIPCEEILEEDEPICGGDALNCMNGGVYEIDSISLPVLVPVDSTKRPTVP